MMHCGTLINMPYYSSIKIANLQQTSILQTITIVIAYLSNYAS